MERSITEREETVNVTWPRDIPDESLLKISTTAVWHWRTRWWDLWTESTSVRAGWCAPNWSEAITRAIASSTDIHFVGTALDVRADTAGDIGSFDVGVTVALALCMVLSRALAAALGGWTLIYHMSTKLKHSLYSLMFCAPSLLLVLLACTMNALSGR